MTTDKIVKKMAAIIKEEERLMRATDAHRAIWKRRAEIEKEIKFARLSRRTVVEMACKLLCK